jgi:molybdopterin-guanine dinucleotide biosynthesis protein A
VSRLAALILAGGRSNRMGGGDKPLLDLVGRPMLAQIIDRLSPQADLIAINANGDPARFASFDLPIIPDATQDFDGPLAGILAGLEWAKHRRCSHLLTIAGDTPFMPSNLAQRLTAAARGKLIGVAASAGRVHPTFAIWSVSLRTDLEKQLGAGMRRVVDFVARHPSIAVDFPIQDIDGESVDPFFNVNTPQQLAEARRLAQKLVS